jgi:hypothetical protein
VFNFKQGSVQDYTPWASIAGHGRFCCGSLLQALLVGDSVPVMRFAAEASDDGAARSRPETAFLRIQS